MGWGVTMGGRHGRGVRDRAFDTGPIFDEVFSEVAHVGLPHLPEVVLSDASSGPPAACNCIIFGEGH